MKNNLLVERIAEAELGRMDMDDKMEILHKAICIKFRLCSRTSKRLGWGSLLTVLTTNF
jgi:hypothetical protein